MSSIEDKIKVLEDRANVSNSEIKDTLKQIKLVWGEIRVIRRWIFKAERLLSTLRFAFYGTKGTEALGFTITPAVSTSKFLGEKMTPEGIKEMTMELTRTPAFKTEIIEGVVKKTKISEEMVEELTRKTEETKGLLSKITSKFSIGQIMFLTSLILQVVTIAIDRYEEIQKIERQKALEKEMQGLRNEIYDKVSIQMKRDEREALRSIMP